jgi:hypothetical protein
MNKWTVIFATVISLLAVGCGSTSQPTGSSSGESAKEKMQRVVTEAIRQSDDPLEKAALQEGKVFVNLKDLDMEIVGVSLVMNAKGNRGHISFTRDRFEAGTVEDLAKAVLEDLRAVRQKLGEGEADSARECGAGEARPVGCLASFLELTQAVAATLNSRTVAAVWSFSCHQRAACD